MADARKPLILQLVETYSAARRRVGLQLHKIEQNPLTDQDIAMFEMFDREGWSPEQRRAYIISHTLAEIGK